MKNRKTENSIREEVMKSKPDNLDGILRQCGKQEDIISVKRAGGTKKMGWLKTACCIAAALVILAVESFCGKRHNQQAGYRDITGCKPEY